MNDNVSMLQSILEALMTINTKGNDTITMSNILQAMNNIITDMKKSSTAGSEEE